MNNFSALTSKYDVNYISLIDLRPKNKPAANANANARIKK